MVRPIEASDIAAAEAFVAGLALLLGELGRTPGAEARNAFRFFALSALSDGHATMSVSVADGTFGAGFSTGASGEITTPIGVRRPPG